MKNASRYRALASLCRQHAAYRPDQRWQLLSRAEWLEHRAEAELSDHFKKCNPLASSGQVAESEAA